MICVIAGNHEEYLEWLAHQPEGEQPTYRYVGSVRSARGPHPTGIIELDGFRAKKDASDIAINLWGQIIGDDGWTTEHGVEVLPPNSSERV